MPRGKRREHGRKPSVEVVEFTAPLVHAFLVKAASGDKSILVPAVDSPAIATLTDDLIAWQWLVRLERNHVASKQLRERLAGVCRASDEIIPPLRAEAEAALRMTEGANPTTPLGSREIAARPVFRGAIRDLDALAAAVAAVGENPSYCTRRRACPPWIFGRPTLAV